MFWKDDNGLVVYCLLIYYLSSLIQISARSATSKKRKDADKG